MKRQAVRQKNVNTRQKAARDGAASDNSNGEERRDMQRRMINPALTEIHDLLYQFGVKATIQGYFETSSAIFLAMRRQQEGDPWFSIMDIYREISELYHVELGDIDPRIRRVIRIAWKTQPEYLSRIAGEKLQAQPSPRQFIDMLSGYLLERRKR